MKTKVFFLGLFGMFAFIPRANALEGVYLGGELGFAALTGSGTSSYGNALGFGIDVGLRTNPILDIMLGFGVSSHTTKIGGSDLTSFRQTLSAELHVARAADFDFTIGAGPGFYFYKTTTTDTKFGFNFGAAVDVIVDEHLAVGMGGRVHTVFDSGSTGGFWTAMMRVGYLFEIE